MRKKWLYFLILLLLIVIIAACGHSKDDEQGQRTPNHSTNPTNPTNPTEEVTPTKPQATNMKDWTNEKFEVTFTCVCGQIEEEIDFWFAESVRKKYPNITFTYLRATDGNRLQDRLATGQNIDIFFDARGVYEENLYMFGLEYDMTELVKAHNIDLGQFEPVLLNEVYRVSGGEIHMLPFQTNRKILFYNKGIFDKFGLDYPVDGMTWSEMLDLSAKITRKDGDDLYFGFSNQSSVNVINYNQLSLNRVDLETNKVTINTDPAWRLLLETFVIKPYHNSSVYAEWFNKGNNAPPALASFYRDQNLAMITYIASLLGQVYVDRILADLDWDIVSLPTLDGLPNVGSQPSPIYVGVTNLAKNKEAAMAVVKHMVSEEYQAEMSRQAHIPVLESQSVKKQFGAEIINAGSNINWQAVFYHDYAPMSPIHPQVNNTVTNKLGTFANRLAKGEFDLNTMLRLAEEDIQKYIDETIALSK